jgi:hypothetical protein
MPEPPISRFDPPGPCPVCGADVTSGATACPECGSCHGSGWSEAAGLTALNLPDDEFDYDKFVNEEFGTDHSRSPSNTLLKPTR